ncbi:ATP-dependent helicase HrpB [Paenibacillus sp. PDC88]|uniref:ATP-dependent helicase HrpB n=1 Tax=Paenibacillus sp. PDC88 TaxID=1884375 RepID=UPI00089C0D23|nr:ATP-dependent helicase HrpB [Paenibacillus sp. PDC88]SDW12714.1 ATP-dependent helicase HrpB [Paenibacillus sp. PDC88]
MHKEHHQGHPLPIVQIIPDLKRTLAEHTSAVLIAEPGAGKTTVVPLELYKEPWLGNKKIIMLEPRRLAARNAAVRMAKALNEPVGQTVGYRVRHDTKVSRHTQIEVVTEGVLTRMLQQDQGLEDTALLIFDEFHERNIHGDLSLALALESKLLLRDDLRILVMSATLEAEPVSGLLGGAPVLSCEGRTFPVETNYAPVPMNTELENHMAHIIQRGLANHEGDILAFLPGAREIHRTERLLQQMNLGSSIHICPLYGSLTAEEQDAAIRAAQPGERKVVLATTIAESSLTIEGITVVVDSGLRKESLYSSRTGMNRLVTRPISKASSDQRRGRAGRVKPGVCYRLWSQLEQDARPESSRPEILSADLAQLTLELSAWGVTDPGELSWLDAPPPASYEEAKQLLRRLGCLNDLGTITGRGLEIAGMGTHPRLGSMLLQAAELGLAEEASLLAALLAEGSSRMADAAAGWDIRPQLTLMRAPGAQDAAKHRILQESRQLLASLAHHRQKPENGRRMSEYSCGLLLAFAYPDRIGQRREDGRYLLSSGRGTRFPGAGAFTGNEGAYIVVAEADDQGADGLIRLAAPLSISELMTYKPEWIQLEHEVKWDYKTQSVRAKKRQRLDALILKEMAYPDPPEESIITALLEGIKEEGLRLLTLSKAEHQLIERIKFMHRAYPEWPELTNQTELVDYIAERMAPYLIGIRTAAQLQKVSIASVLMDSLTWEERQLLEREAPIHFTAPSGSRVKIEYSGQGAPYIAVRLQEMFGLERTPAIGNGRVPLTVHLLSPAQRPVQVTKDLESFWREGYFEVKKDLKGRYPKHYWPDNPLEAMPTSRVRPK